MRFEIEQMTNSNKKIMSSSNTEKSEKVKSIQFNPYMPGFNADPYPIYHYLRAENPICHTLWGEWVFTRYEDVKTILRERRVYSHNKLKSIKKKNKYLQHQGKNLDALADASNKFLFYMNPPDHTRLRSLLGKAFSPVVVERMCPQIQTIVDECLDKALDKKEIDIIGDLAEPLPVKVIAKMLGVPSSDALDRLHQWSQILSRILDSLISLEEYEAMNKAILEFQEYFSKLISKRIQNPQDDLISYLIAAKDESGKLSEEEVLSICMQLFATGEETTVNLIGNGMLALLNHPEQLEKLRQEPRLIQTAVEEMLRYDSPVQITSRTASDNLEIDNRKIRKGERINICLGAANRDSTRFPDPDRFDILRQENHHLAFSDGIHYCLGAALARAQAEIAINSLVQKLPNIELASNKLEWRKNIALRGLKSLPVTFST